MAEGDRERAEAIREVIKEVFKALIALIAICYTFYYIHEITFSEVPEQNQRFADMILGSLLTIVLGKVLSEYFNHSGR